MKNIILFVSILVQSAMALAAADKFDFNFRDKDIVDVITEYSRLTGDKFILTRGVAGHVTTIFPNKIDKDEAFAALSEALKVNGYGVVKYNDHFEVRSAPELMKDGVEFYTQLPTSQPARVLTYMRDLKYADADQVMKVLRPYVGQNGDITYVKSKNTLMVTDWSANVIRIDKIIDQIDVRAVEAAAAPRTVKK